jgi:hypothetical protein
MHTRLQSELWISWASLLRAYAAAQGVSRGRFAAVDVADDAIAVRFGERWIRFTQERFEANDGSSGAFALNEDGTVSLDGKMEEMDLAAERVTRELMQ